MGKIGGKFMTEDIPEEELEQFNLSAAGRAVLASMPQADLVRMVDKLALAASINANNNTSSRLKRAPEQLAELSRTEMMSKLDKVPTSAIREVLRMQGIL
jgi:hypothetical protein